MKILKRIKSETLELKLNGLRNLDNVQIIVYSDSSFGNLDNGGSLGGFILGYRRIAIGGLLLHTQVHTHARKRLEV